MNKIKLWKPLWWLLHVAAVAFVLWMGHVIKFVKR